MAKQLKRPLAKVNERDRNLLSQSVLVLSSETIRYTRKVYGMIDLLGDLGGVIEIVMLFFGFFLYPISEHSFNLEAIKKLFFASTSDETLFEAMTEDQ